MSFQIIICIIKFAYIKWKLLNRKLHHLVIVIRCVYKNYWTMDILNCIWNASIKALGFKMENLCDWVGSQFDPLYGSQMIEDLKYTS